MPTAFEFASVDDILDFIGVGFGPSNLALAVAAQELDPTQRGLFFERRPAFDWHPGLLFDSSRMQISFLKDLATLRNPASPFSFLQYTKAKGRLERFVNVSEFHPTRWEYRDYLRWVAASFAHQIRYGWAVRAVTPASPCAEGRYSLFKVEVENLDSADTATYWARNVVYAAGGKPRYPDIQGSKDAIENIIHSSEFLHRFPQRFADTHAAYRFGVIGDGQSAGEIVLHLLQRYPNVQVHLFISGYALRPVDRSPFVNEAFFSSEMEAFNGASSEKRELLRQHLRSTNYGVVSAELIDQIYNANYLDTLKGVQRLFIHPFTAITSIQANTDGVIATSAERCTGEVTTTALDGLMLATGFERKLDPEIFAELLPHVQQEPSGALRLTRNYRVEMQPRISAGLYVQGYGEASHGLADTLLSLLPFRSRDIFNDMCQREPQGLPVTRLRDVEYPPKRHLEDDPEKLYAVLESCRFATLVSARDGEPVITHVPLILDRTKGLKGTLFGHMDRANPHLDLLAGREVLAVFHGPNAYISPHVYTTEQLPTWNSVSVHVRGKVQLLSNREALLHGLASISATDTRAGAYRLDLEAPVIDRLTNYIVGFEIQIDELIGRFKLSQDRNAADQRLAAIELARSSEAGERALIEHAMGYVLEPESPAVRANGSKNHPLRQPAIHELFEAQVSRSPTAAAILCEEQQVSYAELNARANQLAHSLRALGAGPEVIVGLCMERSADALVALLGILKSGAAYLPLDPEHPRQRLEHLLRDAAVSLLVTEARFKDRFPTDLARVICMDSDWPGLSQSPTDNVASNVDARNLAYCMFTSGSTGKAKAVALSHEGLVNHSLHMQGALRLSASDRMLQFLPLSGDGSLEEIFVPLITGATLVPLAEQLPSSHDFLSFLCRQRISVINLTTAYWHFWVGEMSRDPPREWPETLRLVMMGGEAVNPEKYRQWRQLACARNVTWMQEYGPTEATISCTVYEAAPGGTPDELSIGRPISNVQIHIVDEQTNAVPPGEIGELCIAGIGLARGYLGQPRLTAEKFVPNPFGAPGTRLYKTGDFARFRPDGTLQFLGRRDDQVKVLGHRIELGEIESALLQFPGVREAVVVAHASAVTGVRLAAYVVADTFFESRVRQHLAETLPRQMMPAVIIPLAALPVNANGKIDRARLPATDPAAAMQLPDDSSELELAIARLWTESTGRAPRTVDEDFFLVGGDSLRALSLLGRIGALTGIDIDVAAFFKERTVRMLAASLLTYSVQEGTGEDRCFVGALGAGAHGAVARLRRDTSRRRPASNAQQRLWFLDRLQQAAAYSVPLAYRVRGTFSVARLDHCLTRIVARHEALRTALVTAEDAELWQEVAPPMEIRSRHLQAGSFAEAMTLAQAEASQPFDLTKPPLLRSVCIQISDGETLWFVNFHHSMWDAWSLAVVWRELMMLYAGAQELPALPFQYADYAQWQREWLASKEAEADRAFWRQQLAGDLPLLQLGRLAVPEPLRSTRGAMELCPFDSATARATRAAAERHGTTEFVILLSAFLATLHRLTRQDQIVIGVPVACRSRPETEGIVGFLANTLPLRIVFPPRTGFCHLVEQTAQCLTAALAHQELPFDQIVDTVESARQGSRNPIFQAMFVMQTTPLDEMQRLGEAAAEEVIIHSGTSKVDLTCSIRSGPRGLEGELEYSTDLLSTAEAQRFVQSFLSLLSAATQDASAPLDELSMVSFEERAELIQRANSRFEQYPDFRPLHTHFAAQALAMPDAIAIQSTSGRLDYRALDARANRLAQQLIRAGVERESLVGICMDRSIGMVTALLATLKAGAGFVPLDPHFPLERIRTIAADAGMRVIVTEAAHAPALASLTTPLLVENTGMMTDAAADDPQVSVCAENVAYVYYTSGSTGAPKGVILEHRGALNRLEWLRRRYPLNVGDRVILKTPLIFDLSIWEIFGPLMAGATILMADARAESDVTHIGELLSTPGTVFAYFVPSMLDAYLSYAAHRSYPSLKWLCVTGEAMPARLLERFNQHFEAEFHSTYGQTETSEVALWTGSQWDESATIPVGRPNGIYRLFVLDPALRPVPPYVPGEICVAGIDGLARGYQGQPGLTAEKFVPNPYAIVPGERLYRTGDLGCLLADGQIEYVGRLDTQVKIRGCRVETAEIESVLSQHPSVRLCAVMVRTDASGGPELIAYVVSDGLTATDLAAHAEKVLPPYMLPAAYVFVSDLPLTPSGKLDRTRLPAPTQADFSARATHEAPQSALESELAGVWQRVLGLESVGRSDNFFSLGGNSLKSIQVLVRVADTYGVNVSVRDFFNAPTIEGLAAHVEQALLAYVTSLSASELDERLALPSR
ncbi:MAG: amino acid adenylation domain-containing protein [Gammaproteobacteria bacterium]